MSKVVALVAMLTVAATVPVPAQVSSNNNGQVGGGAVSAASTGLTTAGHGTPTISRTIAGHPTVEMLCLAAGTEAAAPLFIGSGLICDVP
jgi:hypothetical protein